MGIGSNERSSLASNCNITPLVIGGDEARVCYFADPVMLSFLKAQIHTMPHTEILLTYVALTSLLNVGPPDLKND